MSALAYAVWVYAETDRESIIYDSILAKPLGYREFPLGYRENPLGYRETPPGYRETPPGYREVPLGYVEQIPNTLVEPRGFMSTPPNYSLRQEHPLVNTDESNKIAPKVSTDTLISENFRSKPPNYRSAEEL